MMQRDEGVQVPGTMWRARGVPVVHFRDEGSSLQGRASVQPRSAAAPIG